MISLLLVALVEATNTMKRAAGHPQSVCPPGVQIAHCLVEPCATASCGAGFACIDDYCGGCNYQCVLKQSNSPLVGLTVAKYNGSMIKAFYDKNGYDDARQACQTEFGNDTHVCTTSDLGILAQVDGLGQGNSAYRYVDMSFQRDFTKTPALSITDCRGFTTASVNESSHCVKPIIGGAVLPSFCECDHVLPFLCCADINY